MSQVADIKEDKKIFDFTQENVVLHLDTIINSCFKNPHRHIHKQVRYASVIKITDKEEYDSAEKVLDKIKSALPRSYQAFNKKKIWLFSTEGLRNFSDTPNWNKGLKSSRWYGPFLWEQKQPVLIFHSVTSEGYFDGAAIGIEFGSQRIYYLRFKDNGIEMAKG